MRRRGRERGGWSREMIVILPVRITFHFLTERVLRLLVSEYGY